ncbi:MAG: thioesterase family protein [Candidatus Rokubacteria bacterium]|nr:thioesterase family protein [Candidatus Rokubacteria bacterium]
MSLAPGTTHEIRRTVTADQTADAMGNTGVMVFATPAVLTFIENACSAMLLPHLPAGAATVGTKVDMKHLGATPLGMEVRATATLLETDGRKFVFSVEVWDTKEKVAEATHERFLVNDLAKFLARAMKKAER